MLSRRRRSRGLGVRVGVWGVGERGMAMGVDMTGVFVAIFLYLMKSNRANLVSLSNFRVVPKYLGRSIGC